MVYRYYIKRGTKRFGPYYYRSYRENGKFKKEYLGMKLPKEYKKTNKLLLILILALIGLTILGLALKPAITGFVTREEAYQISTIQQQAEINKAVKWQRTITLTAEAIAEKELVVKIPAQAYNIKVDGKEDVKITKENWLLAFLKKAATITGFAVQEQQNLVINVTEIFEEAKEEANVTEINITEVEEIINETVNITNITEENITNISGINITEVEEIVNETLNITNITEVAEAVNVTNVTEKNITKIEIEYKTAGPKIREEQITPYRKRVIVYSDIHYENILAFTQITEIVNLESKNKIKVYWTENNTFIDFNVYDTNNNSLIDRVEWNVPSLSSQTFEIIIEISKAEHLDENRNFLSDIYNEVKARDNVWSEPVYHNQYVRVQFRRSLTSVNDITIYARNTQQENTKVEVYHYNSNEKITEFPIITEEKYYKVFLTGMQGSHDTFDLKIVNTNNNIQAFLELDYIVDPTQVHKYNYTTNGTGDKQAFTFGNLDAAAPPYTEPSLAPAGEITTQLTAAQYTSISTLNQAFYMVVGSTGDFSPLYLHLWIDENIADITEINITAKGVYTQTANTQMGVYVYNYSNPGYYKQIGTNYTIPTTASPGTNFTRTITGGFSDFINATDGKMYILFVDHTANIDESFDYVEVAVSYTADTDSPIIQLQAPANASTWTANNSITFIYNVTDITSGITNCSLYINSTLNTTDTSVTELINQTFDSIPMSNGYYSWNITCFDDSTNKNSNTSATRYLTVNYTPVLYGTLNATLNTPTPNITTNVNQNQTFWVNATVYCAGSNGALCGNVSAYARYNASGAGASEIAVDNVSNGTGTGTNITVSHTTGEGANRLMLVGISGLLSGIDPTISNVTYGGVALTQVGTQRSPYTGERMWIYRLVAPTSGTANVIVTFGAAMGEGAGVGVMTLTGVDQTTPLGTFVSANGTSTTASVNVSSASGELVFDTLHYGDTGTPSVGAGQTQRWNLAGGTISKTGGSTEPGAATVTMSWTFSPSNTWAIGAVPIKPAAGSLEQMTAINTTTGATPFYTTSAQPQSCVLTQGNSCQFNWSVNATGTVGTKYKINVNFSSNYSQVAANETLNATINITTAPADTTPPTWNNNQTNASSATKTNQSVYFNVTFTDANPAYYKFATNQTGTWVNYTGSYTSGVPIQNISTITATESQFVSWYFWANDTFGNSNQTDMWNFTVAESTPPTYSDNSTNSTLAGTSILHSLRWADNIGLSGYIFSFDNGTGTLTNDTWTTFLGKTDINNGLMGYWKLDSVNSTNYTLDSSGNNNDGVVFNYTTLVNASSNCIRGNCLFFNHTGTLPYPQGAIQIPSSASLNPLTNITLAGWFHISPATDFAGYPGLIYKSNIGDQYGIYLDSSSTPSNVVLKFAVANNSATQYGTASNLPSDQWVFIAVTYNANSGSDSQAMKIYIDGALNATQWGMNGNINTTTGYAILCDGGNGGFRGYCDELRVYNRTLSASEISQLYSTTWSNVTKTVNSTVGATIRWCVYANDTSNNWNKTSCENPFSFNTTSADAYPTWSNNGTNASAATKTQQSVYFNVTLSDDVGGGYYKFAFYNGSAWSNTTPLTWTSPQNVQNITTITATRGMVVRWYWWFNDSTGQANTTYTWNFTVANTAPTQVVLDAPANNNITTNRTPQFNWTAVTDVDGDSINYTILINCSDNGGQCTLDDRETNLTGITNTSYVPATNLKLFGDDNYYYNWSVRAYDGYDYGTWSSERKITINSLVELTLTTNNINFGELQLDQKANTTDPSYPPFAIRNDGNSYNDLNISSNNYLWTSQSSPSEYFQYKVDNVTGEEGAFNSSGSQTSWQNVPITNTTFVDLFNYTDVKDSAEIDILVWVPLSEPAGSRSSILTFTGWYVKFFE